jgi:hypothetical protein
MATIVAEMQKNGITIFRDGDDLRFRAHSAPVPEAVRQELSLRRGEILQYLKARECAIVPAIHPSPEPPVPSVFQDIWWNWIDPGTSLTLSLIEFIREADTDIVIDALRQLVAGHEALRSSFRETAAGLTVETRAAEAFAVETQTLAPGMALPALRAHADEFIAQPLVASAEWLVRIKLFILPGRGHVAVLVANHMVVDGTSIDILRSDLRRRLKKAASMAIPGQGIRYADFARWQRLYLAQSGRALSDYWRGWSRNQPQISSPLGRERLVWRPGAKVRRTFTIPSFAQAAVADMAQAHSTFPFFIYLTVLALAVGRWSDQSEFPLRCICDARDRPDLAGVVGLMTGADAIHVSLDSQAGLSGNLVEIEREYRAASRLRLPNIYAVPPFVLGGGGAAAQEHNVAIVLNYRKAISHSAGTADKPDNAAWPPREGAPRRDQWRHDVSPICLELTQVGGMATAAFLLHEDFLSVREQDSLIRSFFEIFEESLLRKSHETSGSTVLQNSSMASAPQAEAPEYS